jgi:hypothetical protein
MTDGVVLETGVTIKVNELDECGKDVQQDQFHDVVKVKMSKRYLQGDLGAPVYIPIQIPNSKQMAASPVGQVVEVYN